MTSLLIFIYQILFKKVSLEFSEKSAIVALYRKLMKITITYLLFRRSQ